MQNGAFCIIFENKYYFFGGGEKKILTLYRLASRSLFN